MASIKDFPNVVRRVGFVNLAKKVWQEVQEDLVFTWASALAYAWIFAIVPFMVFLLSLTPYLPGPAKDKAIKDVSDLVYSRMGGEAGYMIVSSVESIMKEQRGGLLSIGLILALWGASGGMAMTMSALDKAYEVEQERGFVKQRLMAVFLTICAAVLVLIVLFLLPVGAAITAYLARHGHIGTALVVAINILRYVVAIALLFALIALIYYFGPSIKQKWQTITPGAVFTVAVWIVLGLLFSWYIGNFANYNKTYGALGGAIILLLFFYINAAVLLVGAELNSELDFVTLGVKPGERDFTRKAIEHAEDQREEEADEDYEVAVRPSDKRGGAGRRILIWAPAILAGRWLIKRVVRRRAST